MQFEPIPFSEIESFDRLYAVQIEPWEVDLLCRLDGVWMESVPKDAT